MQAWVLTRYGGPRALQLREVEKPTPQDDQVLIRVHAVAVNAADWRLMKGRPLPIRIKTGFPRPDIRTLGGDVAGVVEAAGAKAARLQPGDAVFGYSSSENGLGGLAEYVAVPEDALALKPEAVPFDVAAAVPLAAITALQGLRYYGEPQPGHKVLIYGASGGVGTMAVQLAKAYGAEVTAVCSTRNVEQARRIGADHVIDYKREDFSKRGERYDLILGANGCRRLTAYQRALRPSGKFVMAGGALRQIFAVMIQGPKMSEAGGQQFGHMGGAQVNRETMRLIKDLVEAGKLYPVIERRYRFQEAREALGHIARGHARGKIVITVVE